MNFSSTPSRSACPARSRTAFAFLFAALLAAAGSAPARVEMEVRVGFNEATKVGRWTPIFVTLENKPDAGAAASTVEDFVGRVEYHSGEVVGTNRQAEFSLPVELPANGRKLLTLYAKLPDARRSPTVRLLRVNGSEVLSVPATARNLLEPSGAETLLVVVEPPQGDAFASPLFAYSERKFSMARVDGRSFPESWIGLEAVDAVVIPRLSESLLNEKQLEALAEWVRMGGRLLLLGGQDTPLLIGSKLEELLPVDPLGFSQREATARFGSRVETRRISISDVRERSGAAVVASYETADGKKAPIAWRVRRGLGETHFWAYDARGAREENWIKQLEWTMWEALVRQNYQELARELWREKYRPRLDESPRVLENAAEPPNIAFVIGLIVVYFLVVGPLNFATLKKRRRLELAWFTIPAIVFVFSGFMYFVGWLTMGNENIRRDVSLIQGEANQVEARVETLACYFAAHAGNRSVSAGDHSALCFTEIMDGPSVWSEQAWSDGPILPERSFMSGAPGVGGISLAGGGAVPTKISLEGEKPRIDEFFANQWTWNALEAQGPFALGGQGVVADVVHGGDHLEGEIENLTDWTIQDAFVFVALTPIGFDDARLSEIPLGDLPAGGPPVSLTGRRRVDFAGGSSRAALLSAADSRIFSESVRDRFLGDALAGNSAFPKGRAFLCGFVDLNKHGVGVTIGGSAHVSSRLGFAMIHLPMRPAASGARLGAGSGAVVPVRVDETEPPARASSGSGDAINVFDNAATPTVFAIESPFDCGVAKLENASLVGFWSRGQGPAAPVSVEFSVASYQSRGNELKPAIPEIQRNVRAAALPSPIKLRDLAARFAAEMGEYLPEGTQTMFVSAAVKLDNGERPNRRPLTFAEPDIIATYEPAE